MFRHGLIVRIILIWKYIVYSTEAYYVWFWRDGVKKMIINLADTTLIYTCGKEFQMLANTLVAHPYMVISSGGWSLRYLSNLDRSDNDDYGPTRRYKQTRADTSQQVVQNITWVYRAAGNPWGICLTEICPIMKTTVLPSGIGTTGQTYHCGECTLSQGISSGVISLRYLSNWDRSDNENYGPTKRHRQNWTNISLRGVHMVTWAYRAVCNPWGICQTEIGLIMKTTVIQSGIGKTGQTYQCGECTLSHGNIELWVIPELFVKLRSFW